MKAMLSKRFGSAERLALVDVPMPTPGDGEILIRVHATSVTPGDVILRKMPRLVTRLVGETPKSIPGNEYAGEVTAVGAAVSTFQVGDRVFGTTSGLAAGSHAEYVVVPAAGVVATIPAGVGYQQAASVPVGAMTALHFLRAGGVAAGARVLVNGASGSVGSFAVQIAREMGAHVTGVAGASNTELVGSLGAHHVVDYTEEDFTEGDRRYDVIFDAVGKVSARRAKRALADDGRFVTTRARRRETVEELLSVRDMMAAGAVGAVIDRTYTLGEIADAHRYVQQGHKRGNVVVLVTSPTFGAGERIDGPPRLVPRSRRDATPRRDVEQAGADHV
jgi:NADPH:quinone reductase-like Zn-dependent oxidoreductase